MVKKQNSGSLKLLTILSSLFVIMAFIGCSSGGSEVEPDEEIPIEEIESPEIVIESTLAEGLLWLRNNAEGGKTYSIIIDGDEILSPMQTVLPAFKNGLTVAISASKPSTISLMTDGSIFTVGGNVTLILGNNIHLKGKSNNTSSLVNVLIKGTLIMNEGSSITDNSASSSGGGVHNRGNFIMNGGLISNNYAEVFGGGVYVNGGTFFMRGGVISGSTAGQEGGGVYIDGNGVFRISNGIIFGEDEQILMYPRTSFKSLALSWWSTAEYGISNDPSHFESLNFFSSVESTIEVVNGYMIRPIHHQDNFMITITGIPEEYSLLFGNIRLNNQQIQRVIALVNNSTILFEINNNWNIFNPPGVVDITLILNRRSSLIKEFKLTTHVIDGVNVIPFSDFTEQVN